jgi:hypothetical protein
MPTATAIASKKQNTNRSGKASQSQSQPSLAAYARQGNLGLVTVKGHILTPKELSVSQARTSTTVPGGGLPLGTLLKDTTLADGNPTTLANAPGKDRGTDGTPGPSDMDYISRLARAGAALDPANLYALNVAPSTQRIDSYWTQMDETSLRNYAAEALLSVPVMNSHRTGGWGSGRAELPLGRSFWGGVEPDPSMPADSGMQRFVSALYMRRGAVSNDNGVSTDSIIGDIEAGILTDISIGFGFFAGTPERNFEDATWLKCSICGRDALAADWWDPDPETECIHWPGQTYASNGGTTKEVCYFIVMNGHLSEFSPVWAGATPGAVVLRAEQATASGNLTRSQIRQLEHMYNVRLLGSTTYSGVAPTQTPALALQERKQMPNANAKKKQSRTGAATVPGQGQEVENETDLEENQEVELTILRAKQEQFMSMVRSLMNARSLSDSEKQLLQKAIDECAAGDTDAASTTLANLMSLADDATDEENADEDDDGATEVAITITVEGGEVENSGDQDGEDRADTTDGFNDDGEGDGEGDGGDRSLALTAAPVRFIRGGESGISLSQLELAANERQQLKSLRREVAALRRENKRLEAAAAVGLRYTEVLVEETVKMATRAQVGNIEQIRSMLTILPVENIELMYQQYKELGDARLSRVDDSGSPLFLGGRQTQALDPNGQHGVVANSAQARRNQFQVVPTPVDPSLYKTSGGKARR